jgi:hypothetical protein
MRHVLSHPFTHRIHLLRPSIVGVYDGDLHVTDAATLTALRRALDTASISAPVVAGSRAHFTELNRAWNSIPREVHGITFSTTPLFHSLGTEQLIESIAVQGTIARQAVDMADGMPVHIGPLTLQPRFNNVATTTQSLPTGTDLARGYSAEFTGGSDERQSAPELAAWTIASAAALAVDGVASVTYFEEWGPRGIRSATGEPYPVCDAIAVLADLRAPDARVLSGESSDDLIWAIGASTTVGDTVLVANLDRVPRCITVTTGSSSVVVEVPPVSFRRVEVSGSGSSQRGDVPS